MKLSLFDTIFSDYNFDNMDYLLSNVISEETSKSKKYNQYKFWKVDEENNQINLFLTLPGFAKDDFDIIFDESYLTIKAKQKQDKKYLVKVYEYSCNFKLPSQVDLDNYGSEYQDGILNVWFKLKSLENPNKVQKRIEIK